jgi:hypothetical protein
VFGSEVTFSTRLNITQGENACVSRIFQAISKKPTFFVSNTHTHSEGVDNRWEGNGRIFGGRKTFDWVRALHPDNITFS